MKVAKLSAATLSFTFARLAVCVLALAVLVCCSVDAQALMVHDLSADFSTSSNPSGGPGNGWGYNGGGLGSGPVTGGYEVAPGYSSGDFNNGQPGWITTGQNHLGWAQISNAGGYGGPADTFDIQNGDVITHGVTSVAWQAQAPTVAQFGYSVDVSVWQIRDADRPMSYSLHLNDNVTPLATGATTCVGPGCDSSRLVPTAIASGLQVNLAAGDFLRLVVNGGDYAGVNFTLTENQVPEPGTGLLLIGGVLAMQINRRRKLRKAAA